MGCSGVRQRRRGTRVIRHLGGIFTTGSSAVVIVHIGRRKASAGAKRADAAERRADQGTGATSRGTGSGRGAATRRSGGAAEGHCCKGARTAAAGPEEGHCRRRAPPAAREAGAAATRVRRPATRHGGTAARRRRRHRCSVCRRSLWDRGRSRGCTRCSRWCLRRRGHSLGRAHRVAGRCQPTCAGRGTARIRHHARSSAAWNQGVGLE
mmetsp:Transcript_26892/g.70649  ORF Transcript_26892/g.70649 Transcript_26892/m.70649 type:complete len:209 (+) Transcript_26892:1751-2377(+)